VNTSTKVVKPRRADFKAKLSAADMDTMNLAHQYFYYLILKDPFAMAEQNRGLAEEAFCRAFGEKPESHFEVTPEMLRMASARFNFLCHN
jgi:hypothetical protein